jgi:hypothetical protein
MSNLEKNPKKGGTPAIENRTTVNNIIKKKLSLRSANEKIVLTFELTNCIKVKNKIKREKL